MNLTVHFHTAIWEGAYVVIAREVRSYQSVDDFIFNNLNRTKGRSTIHKHSGFEIHYCNEGQGAFLTHRGKKPLVSGRITLLYAPTLHQVFSNPKKDYCRTVVELPDKLLAKVLEHLDVINHDFLPNRKTPLVQFTLSAHDHADVRRIFRQMARGLARNERSIDQRVILYLAELFYMLHDLEEPRDDIFDQVNPNDCHLVQQVMRLKSEELNGDFTVNALARRLGVSRSHLWQTFDDVLGMSPAQYLLEQKMEHAKKQLSTGLAVTEVARACGYTELSSFSRAFKSYAGVTPRAFQRD